MEAKTQAWSGTGTALAALAIGVPVHLATDGPFGVALIFYVVAAVALIVGWTPLLRRKFGAGLDNNREESDASTDRLGEHANWMKDKKGLERLYDEGQSLIEHHWPEPDDREAQKHYREWERRTADYLEAKLGKSYKVQFRGGDFPVKAALTSMLSPARLRNRIDESLERLSEIIWEYHGPKSPIRAVPRIIGHSYQLEFSNRTGEARIFTVQVSILRQDAVIRGVSGGKSYGATWESEELHKVEINGGALDYIILAERDVLGSGERRQIRFRFPWLKGDGEPVEAYTDPWKHGDQSRCRVDLRVTVSAKPVYEGNPYRGCFRLTPTAFQAISC